MERIYGQSQWQETAAEVISGHDAHLTRLRQLLEQTGCLPDVESTEDDVVEVEAVDENNAVISPAEETFDGVRIVFVKLVEGVRQRETPMFIRATSLDLDGAISHERLGELEQERAAMETLIELLEEKTKLADSANPEIPLQKAS